MSTRSATATTSPKPERRVSLAPWWPTLRAAGFSAAAAALGLIAFIALARGSSFAALAPAVQIHLVAALLAFALGSVILVLRKGRRFHRTAGWTWATLMLVVAGSSLLITGINGDNYSLIHAVSGWVLLAIPLAVIAARRHLVRRHRRAMMSLYFGALVIAGAFAFLPGRTMWAMLSG